MKVKFSKPADSDLEAIGDWIARDDPERADTFIEELSERCLSLADHPRRFPAVESAPAVEIRKLTHSDYLIFYRIDPTEISILRVIHGSRDWAVLFDR